MKNKLRNTIIGLILIVLFSAIAYASVTIAKDRKSTKFPWQGSRSGSYDGAHNVGESYLAQDRFTAGTDIVTDSVTGLMWQRTGNQETSCKAYDTNTHTDTACNDGTANDDCNQCAAKAYCADLNLGGYDNWRLPSIKELQSILDYSRHSPSIDINKFTSTVNNTYWSSTANSYGTSDAGLVSFSHANSNYTTKTFNNYVRCVR